MRKTTLAALAIGFAAAVVPAAPASAFCVGWYYELTGDCSPCDEVDHAIDYATGKLGLGNWTECLA